MKLPNMFTPCYCSDSKNDNTENKSQETGLDRVKQMYLKNDYGFISPEMYYLVQSATIAVSVSSLLGAFIHANQVKDEFMRKNVATQFESQFLARRRLVDTMSLAAIKGGLKYGLKYGSFSSLYLLSTMTAANYNNKITIWEHIGSGALLGGLYRINFGLKGMAAAASVGAVLGAFAGGIFVTSLWYTNTTLQDLRDLQKLTYLDSRSQKFEVKREDLLKR